MIVIVHVHHVVKKFLYSEVSLYNTTQLFICTCTCLFALLHVYDYVADYLHYLTVEVTDKQALSPRRRRFSVSSNKAMG